MLFRSLALALAATAAAAPLHAAVVVEKRQLGSTSNELVNGACRPIVFIFARGSTEIGNMGSTVGPATCSELKRIYGSTDVACQGVGGAYTATISGNLLPQGTTTGAIREAQSLFQLASSKCPNSYVVAGGYSQGAAVMTAAITGLSATVKNQVKGAVLYGDTRNFETGGTIPGYPTANTLILCAVGDGVCGAGLTVTPAHLSYLDDVPAAAAFLQSRIVAAGGPSS